MRNEAIDLMMPKMSCETSAVTLPKFGSGRRMVRQEPETVIICCSFVPENWPMIARVIAVGCWIVNE